MASAGGFVHFLLHRHPFDDVVEFHLAGVFGKDGHVVRVPLDEGVALLDLGAFLEGNDRADDDGVIFQFAPSSARMDTLPFLLRRCCCRP